jgi:hypothetical protein
MGTYSVTASAHILALAPSVQQGIYLIAVKTKFEERQIYHHGEEGGL